MANKRIRPQAPKANTWNKATGRGFYPKDSIVPSRRALRMAEINRKPKNNRWES